MDWYTSIINEIEACPTSICTTCTTFGGEDLERIGQIGQIDSPQVEKQLLPDIAPHQELADLKSVPFFTNAQGKPLHCIHCPSWGKGSSPWWYHGVCAVSGASKTNKSKCDLIAYEEIIYG